MGEKLLEKNSEIAAQLRSLGDMLCNTCIISEVKVVHRGSKGKMISKSDLLHCASYAPSGVLRTSNSQPTSV